MPRRDPRVTRYIQSRQPFARPLLTRLRRQIHASGKGIDEGIKWGMPAFLYRGKIVCGIAGFNAHCAIWFWKGTQVVGKKPREGMGHFGRITSAEQLPAAAFLKACVRKSMKGIDDTVPRR